MLGASAHSTDNNRCLEAGFPVQLTEAAQQVRLKGLPHLWFKITSFYRTSFCQDVLFNPGCSTATRGTPTVFSHLLLEQPATALCGYDSSRIDILSAIRVPVHYDSKHLPSLFTGLGFMFRDDSGSNIHHITSTWWQKCNSATRTSTCQTQC